MATKERLQRYLSQCRLCSRRAGEKLIEAGKIILNGKVAVLGDKVDSAIDIVEYLGERVLPVPGKCDYLVLNKPKGVLSSRKDDRGRPVVVDFVDVADTYVYPVGRLDFDSSGLVLLTNDGELAQKLLHPSHMVSKTYRVQITRKLTRKEMARFESGIIIDGRVTASGASIKDSSGWIDSVEPSKGFVARKKGSFSVSRNNDDNDTGFWYEIVLFEGRKRQIRRMMTTLAVSVLQLIRIEMGPVSLNGLPRGWHRRLAKNEVIALKSLNVLDRSLESSETGRGSSEKGKRQINRKDKRYSSKKSKRYGREKSGNQPKEKAKSYKSKDNKGKNYKGKNS